MADPIFTMPGDGATSYYIMNAGLHQARIIVVIHLDLSLRAGVRAPTDFGILNIDSLNPCTK